MDTSFLTKQVTSIIGQLHNVFDEIGVPHHERDSRESELFSSLSETLHSHLRLVNNEKNELIEQGQRLITTIKQMEASLDDVKASSLYAIKEEELKVAFPLLDCLQTLREKHRVVRKLHQERFEQVKKLIQALESYSSHLEPSFLKIKLPPVSEDGTVSPSFDLSPSYITSVDDEFTRVYEEYTRRVATVQQLADETVKLWAELGTPQAQTDNNIVKHYRDAPEQLGLHQDDIANLRNRREKLQEEKRTRERRIKELKGTVEGLWERLGIDEQERKLFQAGNRGCGLRAINDLEDELSRLNELKRQNLGIFVEDARAKLQQLWDDLYLAEEEAVEFTPMFCDVISDALLSAHESEISRLEALKEQRAPTLQLIAKHRSLMKDRDDLAASSQDASRLMKGAKGERRDPTRLLREEKMRKRIAKDLPKIEHELGNMLGSWEDEYGRPFLVFGERYLDTIAALTSKAPPPRSKTPNGLPPRAKTPSAQQPPKKVAKPTPSVQKAPTGRDAGTLRAKTPVGTMGRPAVAASAHTAGHSTFTQKTPSRIPAQKSPSRIPARVPLGTMPHGNNSPERLHNQDKRHHTVQQMGPPLAPPPKMRDLFKPPPSPTRTHSYENDVTRSGSVVRQMPPEDVYGGNGRPAYLESSVLQSQNPMPEAFRYSQSSHYSSQQSYRADASDAANSSRQISATSTTASTALTSGSENWEAYEDGSELERDQRQGYDAQPYGTQGKRGMPDGGYASPHARQGKKVRGYQGTPRPGAFVQADNARGVVVSAEWTDDDGSLD